MVKHKALVGNDGFIFGGAKFGLYGTSPRAASFREKLHARPCGLSPAIPGAILVKVILG